MYRWQLVVEKKEMNDANGWQKLLVDTVMLCWYCDAANATVAGNVKRGTLFCAREQISI